MFEINIIILVICTFATHASVIRIADKETNDLKTTTVPTNILSATEPESTTIKDEDLAITSTERMAALSRDEESTIMIAPQTLLHPAAVEFINTETGTIEPKKSSRLLLLSTPKILEKPKQPEENLEESDEEIETVENVTQMAIETTTMDQQIEETTEMLNVNTEQMPTKDAIKSEDVEKLENNTQVESKPSADDAVMDSSTIKYTTKLFPINDTLYADKKKSASETKGSYITVVENQPEMALNSNIMSVPLKEIEVDYVLVESEVFEGSYADVDSDLHLQPIVQSVEIVPSSLDDTMLINYVQNW